MDTDIKMDINDDNNDYFIPSYKEDVETGIFRRKINNFNNENEKIKKNYKEVNNYVIYTYLLSVLILLTFIIKIILYDEYSYNFKKNNILKYNLNNRYNISHDLILAINDNKND